MNRLTSLSKSLSLLLLLSACANVTTNKVALTQKASTAIAQNGTTSPTPLTETALQGNWESGCTTRSNGAHETTDLLVQDAVLVVTTTSFSDSLCQTPILEEVQISDFTLTIFLRYYHLLRTYILNYFL